MKAVKFAMLLSLITCSRVSQPVDEETGEKSEKVILATFAEAIQFPEMVMAMHRQLDTDFLCEDQQLFFGEIVFEGRLYRLIGTYDQWYAFFSGRWGVLMGWDGIVFSHN